MGLYLEVAVHDAVVVQVLQREHRLREVQPRQVHRQRTDVLQQRRTVTCGNIW